MVVGICSHDQAPGSRRVVARGRQEFCELAKLVARVGDQQFLLRGEYQRSDYAQLRPAPAGDPEEYDSGVIRIPVLGYESVAGVFDSSQGRAKSCIVPGQDIKSLWNPLAGDL